MKRFYVFSLCALMLCVFQSSQAQLTIAQARAQGANAIVTTKGIVTNGNELGTIRYFQDATGGLAVYDFNFAAQMNRGDSILVTGTLVDYNGLYEISNVTNLQILNSGNPLPDAQIFSPAEIGENQEGELVRINDALFSAAGGTFAGNTSYAFTSNSQTLNIYVRNGSPLVGQMIPPGNIDMVGIASQYLTNYQILPRDSNDFLSGPGIAVISSFSQSNLNYNSFSVNWTTNIPGSTGVRFGLTPNLEMDNQYDVNAVTDHSYPLSDLEAGQIYYCQGYSIANGDTAFTPIRPFGTISNSSGTMLAYFNTPCDTSFAIQQAAVQLFESIDDTLIAYLNRAEMSVDLTIYDFNNAEISNISQAINDAVNRGVVVRFISDGSMAPTNLGISELGAGVHHIYSPTSSDYNIMHNKFVVIDANHSDPMKPIVWTGSTNWTDRQINRDNNSVIIVQDQTLARAYTIEFNEMWGSAGPDADTSNSKFGPFKTDNTPHQFFIGNKNVECYFSPSDNVNAQLVQTIEAADSNAYFASMLITRQDIASALIEIDTSGGDVKGIIDNPSGGGSQYTYLQTSMDSSELFVNPDTSVIMHHKFLITDHAQNYAADPTLWVGSHNWTSTANTRNDENTLVIHDASLVNQYYQQLMHLITFQPVVGCTSPNACNYNPAASINDNSCLFIANTCDDGNPNTINDVVGIACICQGTVIAIVPGCTDLSACNFDNEATENDGSCTYPGCLDDAACNFNPDAGCEDNSCIYPGCTNSNACNFNSSAGCDDNSCVLPDGCTDTSACNFLSSATCDDNSCLYPGCTDTLACNYNPLAACSELSCTYAGCTDSLACNYTAAAGCDDNSCILPDGCTDSLACNYDFSASCNNGLCIYPDGCTDTIACNFDSLALCDNGSCAYPSYSFLTCNGSCVNDLNQDGVCDELAAGCSIIGACNYDSTDTDSIDDICYFPGCIDLYACNYNSLAACNDNSCTYPGCTDSSACNYSLTAGCDNGSCVFPGCTNSSACNYNVTAACDDGTCTFPGCIQPNACNFDSLAGCDDGSCLLPGCTDVTACNYDAFAYCDNNSCSYPELFYSCDGVCLNDADNDGICDELDLTGCMDSVACNYNSFAQNEDGSCTFSGCLESGACNYDPLAGCPDLTCVFPGCSDVLACNYDSLAGCDDGSCISIGDVCNDGNNSTLADTIGTSCACEGILSIMGCTDSLACNYDELANTSDSSCVFVGDVCNDGDTATASDTISANCECIGYVVGFDESRADALRIRVYPNPAETQCTVELLGISLSDAWIRLTDLAGNIVIQKKIKINQLLTLHSLDVSNVSRGLYLIEVASQSYATHQKIVIN